MMRFRLLLACLILWGNSGAQNYSFTEFNSSQGLPQSQVECITQGKNGYLWVGTLGGLAQFNGKKFKIYSVKDGLFNNRIHTLTFIDGNLYIGHTGGISVYSKNNFKKYSFVKSDLDAKVTRVTKYKEKIVISTYYGQLYTFDFKKNELKRLPNNFPDYHRGFYDMLVHNNELLLATNEGILKTTDLKKFHRLKQLPDIDISALSKTSNGDIWVSTFESGFYLFDSSFKLKDSLNPFSNFGVNNAIIDSKNNLWLASVNGLGIIKHTKETLLINGENGLPIYSVRCTFEDRDGTIWCGTDGKGLLRFNGERIKYYNESSGLPTNQFLSLHKLKNGTYLYGCYDLGLYAKKRNGNYYKIPMDRSRIWDIEEDQRGNIWCGTEWGLAEYKKNGKINYYYLNGLNRVNTVKRINNVIYVGGESLGIVKNGEFKRLYESQISTIGVIQFFEQFQNKILCASSKGIFEISGNKVSRFKNFNKGATCIVVDKANHLWVGTENGLYILKNDRFIRQKIADDPASNTINFIEVIQNNCYIGTNNGLYVLNSLTLAIERHYGLNDGLISLECNANSSMFDGKHLWFGTAEGLIQFDPFIKEDLLNKPNPTLNISSILVNFSTVDFKKYATRINDNNMPEGLRLPHLMNNIIIETDGISLSNPDALQYQFWLEGQDDQWSKPTSNSTITLSNISDGDHLLHIRVTDQNGKVSESILFPIYITPPFWRTWWFYGVIVLVVVLSIRQFFRWKIAQERDRNYKKNLEYKTRLLALEQQSLNASMNRHFIFNALNSIQYFINTQDRISANKYLTNFAKLIRKNLDSAVEAENMVTLQQEIERLELYLSLEAMRFKNRFTYTINENGIDTEAIVVPGMLLQPFVENSIIHGILPNELVEGKIEVNIRKTEDHLEITVDDNGIGIEFSLNKKQLMQGDHKSQGMEITSKRIDIIRELSQKDFELEGPFQLYNPDNSIKGTRVLLKIPLENLE